MKKLKSVKVKQSMDSRVMHVRIDKMTKSNMKFIAEMGETLLAVNLSGSVIIRRAVELLADVWQKLILKELLNPTTDDHALRIEKIKSHLRVERAALYAAAGVPIVPKEEG